MWYCRKWNYTALTHIHGRYTYTHTLVGGCFFFVCVRILIAFDYGRACGDLLKNSLACVANLKFSLPLFSHPIQSHTHACTHTHTHTYTWTPTDSRSCICYSDSQCTRRINHASNLGKESAWHTHSSWFAVDLKNSNTQPLYRVTMPLIVLCICAIWSIV